MKGFSGDFWITLKLAASKKGLKVGGEGLSKLVEIEAKIKQPIMIKEVMHC